MRWALGLAVLVVLLAACLQPPATTHKPSSQAPATFQATSSTTSTTSDSSSTTTASMSSSTPPTPSGVLRLVAVDIGQGAGIVIHFPDGVVVVDAANRPAASTGALVSYLQGQGVTTLKAIVISNPDADHAGGCNELFEIFVVESFYHQGFPKETQTWHECLDAAQAEGVTAHTDADLNPGDLLPLSSYATVRLLNINAGGSEVNPGSIAIRVDFGEFSFILPGDIECAQENSIRASFDVDVDVIQTAHHGSKYGTCDPWLDATTPEAAFIPVGPNSYGHPTPETLGRLQAHGVTIYRTDTQGDITFTSDGVGWNVATEK